MIDYTYPGLTTEASEMLKHQYGFRTAAQSAVSLQSVSPHDILNYEINELGNTDIPDTLNKLYCLDLKKPDSNGNYNLDRLESEVEQLVALLKMIQQKARDFNHGMNADLNMIGILMQQLISYIKRLS